MMKVWERCMGIIRAQAMQCAIKSGGVRLRLLRLVMSAGALQCAMVLCNVQWCSAMCTEAPHAATRALQEGAHLLFMRRHLQQVN